ncbi:hypothetical protein Tco_0775021 [Tanacetum coccineum]
MSQPANDEFSQHLSDDEASNHEDASDTGAAPKQQQQDIDLLDNLFGLRMGYDEDCQNLAKCSGFFLWCLNGHKLLILSHKLKLKNQIFEAQVKKLKEQGMPFVSILHHKAWLGLLREKEPKPRKGPLKNIEKRSVSKQGRKTVKSSKDGLNGYVGSSVQRGVLKARNLRFFQQKKRPVKVLCSIIVKNVRLRLTSLKIRGSKQSLDVADIWKIWVEKRNKDASCVFLEFVKNRDNDMKLVVFGFKQMYGIVTENVNQVQDMLRRLLGCGVLVCFGVLAEMECLGVGFGGKGLFNYIGLSLCSWPGSIGKGSFVMLWSGPELRVSNDLLGTRKCRSLP